MTMSKTDQTILVFSIVDFLFGLTGQSYIIIDKCPNYSVTFISFLFHYIIKYDYFVENETGGVVSPFHDIPLLADADVSNFLSNFSDLV